MSAKHVLIVDDVEDNRYLLRVLLEGHGYEVDEAAEGAEALEMARRQAPDLIVSDILMPVMDGFTLCREWKQDDRLKNISFVFYTATYTDAQDEEFALSLGAERFMVKPAEPDVFMAMIEETIVTVGSPPPVRTGPKAERPTPPATEASSGDERAFLQNYNATLVRKLEDKMQQLESTNRELELDIAARQTAENALRESEERYRGYVDNSPYGVFVTDELGHYVDINATAADITGYAPEELTHMSIADLLSGESLGWGKESFASLLETGTSTGTGLFLRKDGTTFHGRVDAVRLSDTRFLGFLADVSDQQHAEEELRSQAALIDLAHDAIMVRDMEDRIVFWSHGAEETYGWSPDEAVGATPATLLATEFPEPREAIMATLDSSGRWAGQLDHTTKDGRRIVVTSRWSLRRGSAGQPPVVLEINRDITLQVKATVDLAESAEDLRRAFAGAISALAATVEMRDPYTAGHQRRVAQLACAIASELGWEDARIETLGMAALLHDVGKIVVPTEILTKPGRLEDIEMMLIRRHAAAGADTVAMIGIGGDMADVVRQHHERLDGSGYPDGLSGDQVLPSARILAVADVVEAMISHRPYRAALPLSVAMAEIREGASVKYDADVVAACLLIVEERGFQFAD
ncbi:MAG: PAS domain S-box protein [Coriobacteriia bacterium]|nr:PAS domain S-box protein [Coriobacteriia bacterium]